MYQYSTRGNIYACKNTKNNYNLIIMNRWYIDGIKETRKYSNAYFQYKINLTESKIIKIYAIIGSNNELCFVTSRNNCRRLADDDQKRVMSRSYQFLAVPGCKINGKCS